MKAQQWSYFCMARDGVRMGYYVAGSRYLAAAAFAREQGMAEWCLADSDRTACDGAVLVTLLGPADNIPEGR